MNLALVELKNLIIEIFRYYFLKVLHRRSVSFSDLHVNRTMLLIIVFLLKHCLMI